MSSPQYAARELALLPLERVLELPKKFVLAFEDGTQLPVGARETVYSWFFWEFHRRYPNLPLKSTHHVRHVLNGAPLGSKTHTDLLTILFKDTVEAYQLELPEQREPVLDLIYEITNQIHDVVTKLAEEHVSSIDILDFIQVIEHPLIKELNATTPHNHEAIYSTYAKIKHILRTDPSLANNALARALKTGMANENQIMQCISMLGYRTEVDGWIMKEPVMSNFTMGMYTPYYLAAESRSAAKSLYFAEAPLQDSEYFARRLQQLTMVVEGISHTDCHSTDELEWHVKPPEFDNEGKMTYRGDLAYMVGKYYRDDTGKMCEITFDDKSLYNKVIKLRSPLTCKHHNPHHVCKICFGGLHINVSRFANLGHLCSVTMTQQTTQTVISNKHYDGSSVSTPILLSETATVYLETNKARNAYLVKSKWKQSHPKLIIAGSEAVGLTDILSIADTDDLNLTRVSSIENIEISVTSKGMELSTPIYVAQGARKAVLSHSFLKFAKEKRWTVDAMSNFVFDLDGWDFNDAILVLPEMEYSFSDHSKQITKIIESTMKDITDRTKPHSALSTLQELFYLVNSKLNVNLVALEIIIYAAMVGSKGAYSMGRNSPNATLGVASKIITNRSLSTAYAYEGQDVTISSPSSFFKLDRPSSPFDAFIAPNEVVKQINKAGYA